MKTSNSKSFQKALTFAATVAALGASLGVPLEQALAASPTGGTDQMSAPNFGAVQGKLEKRRETGARQMKWKANQYKENKTKTPAAPGSSNMLNPQPLPPKQGSGLAGGQLPAVQK